MERMTALPPGLLLHPRPDLVMNEQTNSSFDAESFDYQEKMWKQMMAMMKRQLWFAGYPSH
jgi:hypothetical protein